MVVMVVMVLKWLKETRFYEGKKNYYNDKNFARKESSY